MGELLGGVGKNKHTSNKGTKFTLSSRTSIAKKFRRKWSVINRVRGEKY